MTERFLTHSTPALIAANAVAIVVATVGGWSLGDLFRLYLIELVAVGVITLGQIRTASKPGAFAKSPGYLLIFFVAHYGSFCVFYLALLPRIVADFGAVAVNFWIVVIVPAVAFAVAHAVSFVSDYLPREASRISSLQAMVLPYARELPVHLPLILAAAFLSGVIPAHQAAIGFAVAKTAIDVFAHITLHRRLTAYAT